MKYGPDMETNFSARRVTAEVGVAGEKMAGSKPLIAIWLGLTALFCGCGPTDRTERWCVPAYKVAAGAEGNRYEGTGELRIVQSTGLFPLDSTHIENIVVATYDEETSEYIYGVYAPLLWVTIGRSESLGTTDYFGCRKFLADPMEVIQLRLDGSENYFACEQQNYPFSDAQLVLWNEGEGAGTVPLPSMNDVVLVGYYTENDGAELLELRFPRLLDKSECY